MRAYINGFPKHGSHALAKACQLLGVPASVRHDPFADRLEVEAMAIFIKRDPRDALLSWLRMCGLPLTAGMLMSQIRDFGGSGETLVEQLNSYAGWLTAEGVLVVEYADLIATDGEMRRIADHLGVPYLDDAFDELPGGTTTWNDLPHADHKALWDAQVEVVWLEAGGADVLQAWGYAPWNC